MSLNFRRMVPGFALQNGTAIDYNNNLINGALVQTWGTNWYVDGNQGSNSNDGRSPAGAFRTMAKAFANVSSGDRIFWRGNIKEQLTTPAGVFDVSIIGCGNRPRHADAHTGNGGYSAATWKQPDAPVAATPLLKVQQQGWAIYNSLFSGAPANTAAIQLYRDGGAGDAERDGSHFLMDGCRVDGAPLGIQDSGGCAFVRISNTLFRGMTTTAIANTVGAGIGTLLCWQILENIFQDNVNHIVMGFSQGTIFGNAMGKFTTQSIDLNGGAGNNVLYQNALSGTYSEVGGYRKANANDSWAGNWNVLAGGVTADPPA